MVLAGAGVLEDQEPDIDNPRPHRAWRRPSPGPYSNTPEPSCNLSGLGPRLQPQDLTRHNLGGKGDVPQTPVHPGRRRPFRSGPSTYDWTTGFTILLAGPLVIGIGVLRKYEVANSHENRAIRRGKRTILVLTGTTFRPSKTGEWGAYRSTSQTSCPARHSRHNSSLRRIIPDEDSLAVGEIIVGPYLSR